MCIYLCGEHTSLASFGLESKISLSFSITTWLFPGDVCFYYHAIPYTIEEIQLGHVLLVVFSVSSNMHMYYAFDNLIYSFSSITTYVFPVWQTYFFFLIYPNNVSNGIHMYLYKILMP